MKREEVVAKLISIGKQTVPHLVDEDIDLNKSYRELGISSLDLMEILTVALKEFKIKIPPEQLTQVNTINGLADAFVKALGLQTGK